MKKFFAVLIATALIASLAACSLGGSGQAQPDPQPQRGSETPEAPSRDWAVGEPVKKSSGRFWVMNNSLTEENVNYEGRYGSGSYPVISGLKDEALQEQINVAIKDRFCSLIDSAEIPPYLGSKLIQARLDAGRSKVSYAYCYCTIQASFENMLSVQFYKSLSLLDDDGDYMSYTQDEVMNLDLRTGKEIKITDLFADSIDGLTYIDNHIRREIVKYDSFNELAEDEYWMDTGLRLDDPFPGIEEDQKYYISGYTGDIILIFDYETPWVHCQNSSRYLSIEMGDVNAYSGRFASGQSLFIEDAPDPYIFSVYGDSSEEKTEYENKNYEFSGGTGYMGYSFSYREDMPWSQMQYLKPGDYRLKQVEDRFKQLCDIYSRYYPGNVNANMYYSTYYGQTGPYTNIFSNYMLSYYTNDPWGEITREGRDDHYVFRGQNPDPLTLEDIFVPGADVKALLKAAFEDNAVRNEGDWVPQNYVTTWEQRQAYFDAVLDYGVDFTIGSDRLYFYINEGAADLFIHQNIGEGLNQYALRNMISYAMYKDLGMENLSIF